MVKYIKSDLEFILAQIQIAEQHAAGADPATLVPHFSLPFGLRTVDGRNNNLLPGNEEFGASDTLFPRLVQSEFLNDADGDTFDANGPAPGGVVTNNDYGQTGNVADADPRIISNLIVDMSLNNPAAVAAALKYAGIEGAEATAAAADIATARALVLSAGAASGPAAAAEAAALVALNTATTALNTATAADTAAQATVTAYTNAIALAPASVTAATEARDAVTLFASLVGPTAEAGDLALLGAAITEATEAQTASAANLAALTGGPNVTATDLAAATTNAANAALLVTQLTNLQTALNLDPNVNAPDVAAAAGLGITNVSAANGVAASLNDADSLGQATTDAATAAGNLTTATTTFTTAQNTYNDAVIASDQADAASASAEADFAALLGGLGVVLDDGGSLVIPNTAPDEGLSAPFNSWFTLFGQFFDHGLDLVTKGGNGVVFVPLQPDDPLITHGPDGIAGSGDEVTNPALQFMALTRATPTLVDPDGAGPLPASPEHSNTTTSWVDQNQTYTSHASHQVFLREYVLNGNGDPVATGKLLDGGPTGGLANWAQIKAQAASMLGIELTDHDVVNVPLLRTDPYGKFIPGAEGFAQVIVGAGADGVLNTDDDIVVEGNPADPVNLFDVFGDGSNVQAQRTGHAFLDDIAHSATPFNSQTGLALQADSDDATGLSETGRYDDELLDAHKITGDGRGNENIGLTSVHHVFHSEHNRLVEHTKQVTVESAVATGDLAFLNAWLDAGSQLTALPANQAEIDALVWNGERIFQAAKFGTEMQYQHLVFEEFARKVQPLVNLFGPYNGEIDPSIMAEFAHVVYRFGHSMLTEDVARMNPDGTSNDIGLIEAFLNPLAFDAGGTADEAAGAVIRGMTRQVGNEIDEFVTGALRNNLLGLPLDLAVLNLARARDTGTPTLNEARAQFYAGTGDAQLKPYESWVDFAAHAKHELSVVNFIAAYGQHDAVTSAITLEDKRKAATALVLGDNDGTPDTVLINGVEVDISDRIDFLNSTNGWTAANSGLNEIDFWIGGLAEKQQPFGGLLGSTFNFVFETQMENLQDSDRFYYLKRLAGTNFLTELEGNSFAEMVLKNTNLGEGGMHLPGDIFSTPTWILEVDQSKQVTGLDANGDPVAEGVVGRGDPQGASIFTQLVSRNNPSTPGADTNYLKYSGPDHVVLGGTNPGNAVNPSGDDILIAGIGDDTVWGDGGNDIIEGGAGVDQLLGGDGNDIITDKNGDDLIQGQGGNDVVNSGDGFDLIILGDGNDFSVGGEDANETFGGEGNDYIIAGDDADVVFGDGGDDWIEGGTGQDLLQGDFGNPFQDSKETGNDIIIGGAGDDDYDSESGDDIMLADDGIERNEGMLGFDWVTYKNDARAADADMAFTGLLPPDQDAIRDRFDLVEGLSGWDLNDTLRGDDADSTFLLNVDPTSGLNNALNNLDQINLIDGLQELLGGATSFSGGNIILGGGGSDLMEGRGGDDVIDGDAKLNVRLRIHQNTDGTGPEIGTADGMTTPISSSNPLLNGKSLVELMFNRTLTPGQLSIVREILVDDGIGDIDRAQFSDALANYEITQVDATTWSVRHKTFDGNGVEVIGVNGIDGHDIVKNVELFQFSDGIFNVTGVPNNEALGSPTIEILTDSPSTGPSAGIINVGDTLRATLGDLRDPDNITLANPTGLITTGVTFAWQVETTPGVWVALEDPVTEAPVTGPTLTITSAMGVDNLSLRVVATFADANGFPEFRVSDATVPVLSDGPVGPDPAAVLGTDLTGVIVDGAALPADSIGILEDEPALEITREALLANVTDISTPTASLILSGLAIRVQDGDPEFGLLTILDVPFVNGAGETVIAVFNPAPDFNGGVTFTFNVSDGTTVAPLEATLEVIPVNDAPIPAPLPLGSAAAGAAPTVTFNEAQLFGNILLDANGDPTDVDGDALSIDPLTVVLANPAQGALTDNNDGTWTFVAAAGTFGDVVVNFTISDGIADVATSSTMLIGRTFNGGGGADNVVGTLEADNLNGGGGTDTLTGLAGNDTLNGGAGGTDVAVFDSTISEATFALGAGTQLLVTTLAEGTDTLTNTENLNFAGTNFVLRQGSNASNNLAGGAGSDVVLGFGGNDTLNGGTGVDVMIGGIGNDTYVVDNAGDVIVENAAEGTDSVQTSLGVYTLAANVDNLSILAGSTGGRNWTGNSLNNVITSNGGADTLSGGLGNDSINGGGNTDTITWNAGDGRDTLNGGAGTDSVIINGDASDETFRVYTRAEAIAQGIATALQLNANTEIVITRNGTDNASIVAELDNVESITFNNGGGAIAYEQHGDFTGTSLSFNTVYINGGDGNDTIDISGLESAHRIVFASNGGDDMVVGELRTQDIVAAGGDTLDGYTAIDNGDGTVTFTNGSNSITYDADSAAAIQAASEIVVKNGIVGTDGNNTLVGTVNADLIEGLAGNDTLNGGGGDDLLAGGAGKDLMNGGAGNDIYIVDASGDRVVEAAGGGTDIVFTSLASLDLAAVIGPLQGGRYANVENLSYTGAGDFTGSGNALANVITGSIGNDKLDGKGGNDILNGGAGDDTYTVSSGNDTIVLNAGFGNDRVVGFDAAATGGQDKIDLSDLGITAETFDSLVTITDLGADTLVTIGTEGSIKLVGVNGVGTNTITQDDFNLGF